MVCHIMFWILFSEPINFDIKYPYMHCFGRSWNTWFYSFSNMISITGVGIVPKHCLHYSGYCYQFLEKWLKHSCNVYPQRLTTQKIWYDLKRYSDIIIFQESERVVMPSCDNVQLYQNRGVKLLNHISI